ncbi:dihydrolipoamide acetyltransferase family protein [Prauserella endophytica]|uniref:Dihydrolipoamide acetyltransferase component of pyruvate dehydrogenase complex n=1 Tax=Prauserella endophytica TaxID=1592324 RepID=A0ABY2RY37_9PSEU|nr:dihydrolipoamide acetyltransferase family protein [Prauserella endophytica]TKG65195.1 2-oxo acid dehydrogenase subunit E2 [Prauserella endophytica]
MAELLNMPAVAAASADAVVSNWCIDEGATFREGDPLVVIETEKAQVEITAEAEGRLLRILAGASVRAEVGNPIAVVAGVDEKVSDVDAELARLGVGTEPAPVEEAPAREVPRQRSAATTERIFASPLARKMAKEAGLRLRDLHGTGPGGRIVRKDVVAAMKAAETAESAAAPVAVTTDPAPVVDPAVNGAPPVRAEFDEVPHTRMRRAIAARLTESKRTAPHFYVRARCFVDRLTELRAELDGSSKVSVNDLVVKAVAKAHELVPDMNVVWTPESVHRLAGVDVAVAVATDGGLVTPVIRDCAHKSVSAIAAEIREQARKAKDGALTQRDLEGGSITVSNLGMFDVEEFAAIINPPHSAILAVGAVRDDVVAVEGEVAIRKTMTVTLSVDHRPVDGVVAARWLAEFRALLENPIRILA